MEDKTLNPGQLPEDMPALDVDNAAPEEVVVFDAAPQEPETLPADTPVSQEAPEELPARNFSEFNVPMDDPQPEEPAIQSALTDDTEFSDMEELPAPAPQTAAAPQEPQPLRKGRPKRKKGDGLFGLPHLLATFIWLAIILAIEGIQTIFFKKKATK